MSLSTCMRPMLSAARHCWSGGVTARRSRSASIESGVSDVALDRVLVSVANAGSAGLSPSSRAQKCHDRLVDHRLMETSRPLSRRRQASSLEQLESEYRASRAGLQATSNEWLQDWMMGVESFDLERVSDLHRQIEAATMVIASANQARVDMMRLRPRPASL